MDDMDINAEVQHKPGHLTLVDGHVHIYDCFDMDALLNAASRNFQAEALRQGVGTSYSSLLMLTETARDHAFQGLLDDIKNDSATFEQWRLTLAAEDDAAILAQNGSGESIILVAGRQIISSEGLEILALGVNKTFSDGAPLLNVLEDVSRSGAIAVIPWAVGKWLGRRGVLLRDLLCTGRDPRFFLGDNGGRPVFWRNPSHFRLARQVGIRILPGSDPLPFASEVSRIGSFGFALPGRVSDSRPMKDIKGLLGDPDVQIQAYGRLQSPYRFFRNQLATRMNRKY